MRANQSGFSVVEVLLAAAIFAFTVTALIGAIIYGRASSADAGDHSRAVLLAEEGIEAVRNIAAASYANLTDGTYGLTQAGNQWTLSAAVDAPDIYTRQIVIASAGTNRKNITSTVSWPPSGGSGGSVTLTSRLVNWAGAIIPPKTWTNAILAASADVISSNNAVKTATAGNYAYTVISATTNNFVITDISTGAQNIGTINLPGTPTNIAVSGNYAFVTNTSNSAELQIVDIAIPAMPVLRASLDLSGGGNGQGVFVSGNYAYVVRASDPAANANELTVVNISTPAAPVVVGGYNNNIDMNEIYVSGSNAYIATGSTAAEMLVLNVSTPGSPTLTASYNAPTTTSAATISGFGQTVLLGTGTTLNMVNVTTPGSPTLLGSFTASGIINDVASDATSQFAFLGTSATTAEFQVVNIGVPNLMTLAKSVDAPSATATISGVAYNTSLDIVVAASASNNQEIMVFTKN